MFFDIWKNVKYVFSNTAANTVVFPQQEKVDFIEPQMWLWNSPHLNPVDYTTWGALQRKVYLRRKFENVDQLKLALEFGGWVEQAFIIKSIDEWRQRLKAVVKNNGGHIEHLFKWFERFFLCINFQSTLMYNLFVIVCHVQGKVVTSWRYLANITCFCVQI